MGKKKEVVHVVVLQYTGCIYEIDTFKDEKKADKLYQKYVDDYGLDDPDYYEGDYTWEAHHYILDVK
jgi:hypothetical protein